MPQAARAGDNTSHGTPLGPAGGSTNVFIGGRPAWRAQMDVHTCPVGNHGGGIVSRGSDSVRINNFPAVRSGDVVLENGPTNAITTGESSVWIG